MQMTKDDKFLSILFSDEIIVSNNDTAWSE